MKTQMGRPEGGASSDPAQFANSKQIKGAATVPPLRPPTGTAHKSVAEFVGGGHVSDGDSDDNC